MVQAETIVAISICISILMTNCLYPVPYSVGNSSKRNLIDRENGEWYWSLRADGSVNRNEDKAGFWKCPYHNGRMCMEIMESLFKNCIHYF